MTTEAEAIVGLFMWVWAHDSEHLYERKGGNPRRIFATVLLIIAAVLLLHALVRAMGWLP